MANKSWLILLALACICALPLVTAHKLETEQEPEEGEQPAESDKAKSQSATHQTEPEEETGEFVGEPAEKDLPQDKHTEKNVTAKPAVPHVIVPAGPCNSILLTR